MFLQQNALTKYSDAEYFRQAVKFDGSEMKCAFELVFMVIW